MSGGAVGAHSGMVRSRVACETPRCIQFSSVERCGLAPYACGPVARPGCIVRHPTCKQYCTAARRTVLLRGRIHGRRPNCPGTLPTQEHSRQSFTHAPACICNAAWPVGACCVCAAYFVRTQKRHLSQLGLHGPNLACAVHRRMVAATRRLYLVIWPRLAAYTTALLCGKCPALLWCLAVSLWPQGHMRGAR